MTIAETFDPVFAASAAGKLGTLIDQLSRAKLVLEGAHAVSQGQHAWSDAEKTRILAQHKAEAEEAGDSILAAKRQEAEHIVNAAREEAQRERERATADLNSELQKLQQQVDDQRAELSNLNAQIATLQEGLSSLSVSNVRVAAR